MKTDVTYGQLWSIRQDIINLSKMHPSYGIFNSEKIKKFYNENGTRLQAMDEVMKECMEAHVQKDEKGKYQMDENGVDWKFKTPVDKELAEEKMKSLFARCCLMVV